MSLIEDELSCGRYLRQLATEYKDSYVYSSIVMCVLGSLANMIIIIVLTGIDMGGLPINNRLFKALAIVDAILVMKYILFVYYSHIVIPSWGAVFMLAHQHIVQVLHMASVCLSLTLAIWRYLRIVYTKKNSIFCSQSRITFNTAINYSLPLFLYTEIMEDKIYFLYHPTLNDIFLNDPKLFQIYVWVYLIFLKLLSCVTLFAIPCWLKHSSFNAKRRKQVLRGYDTQDSLKNISKSERLTDCTTQMMVAILILFLITEFPQCLIVLLIGLNGVDHYMKCCQYYGELFDILALLKGSVNFILYCRMNRKFSTNLKLLLNQNLLQGGPAGHPSEIYTTTYV